MSTLHLTLNINNMNWQNEWIVQNSFAWFACESTFTRVKSRQVRLLLVIGHRLIKVEQGGQLQGNICHCHLSSQSAGAQQGDELSENVEFFGSRKHGIWNIWWFPNSDQTSQHEEEKIPQIWWAIIIHLSRLTDWEHGTPANFIDSDFEIFFKFG